MNFSNSAIEVPGRVLKRNSCGTLEAELEALAAVEVLLPAPTPTDCDLDDELEATAGT